MKFLLLLILVAMAADFLGKSHITGDAAALDFPVDKFEEAHVAKRSFRQLFPGPSWPVLSPSKRRGYDKQQQQQQLSGNNIPKFFDAREKWKECCSIREIHQQGNCSSCWAVVATSVMNDRTCIKSEGRDTFKYSAHNLATCCPNCGDILNGGNLSDAFEYWRDEGIVSGDYGACGCQPYRSEVMEEYKKSNTNPECKQSCDEFYSGNYTSDLRMAKKVYNVSKNVDAIQREIMTHGPVASGIYINQYFNSCTFEEVYSCKGREKPGHAVRIIGWGPKENENRAKYWLVANSYGRCYKPIFKVKRGTNSCGIESVVWAGIP